MHLRPGMRLQSRVCSSEVVVVAAPSEDVDLRCGGESMAELGSASADPTLLDQKLATGTLLGKRYTDGGLELLVTKSGAGGLSVGGTALAVKSSKPLPASD